MIKTPTFFLKCVIYLIGIIVLGLCIILAGVSVSGNGGPYTPMLIIALLAGIPFFYALHQALLLLRCIENDAAFSPMAVDAVRKIKYCAFSISAMYSAGMPLLIYAAQVDDAPGAVLVGLIFIGAPLVLGVYANVLEHLFYAAMEMKSENELTV